MSNAAYRLTQAAEELAAEFFSVFRTQDEEAQRLALEMLEHNQARLRLDLVLTGNPSLRLLLEPTDCEGAPVEVAVIGCKAVEPSIDHLAERIWFFGRLSHWNTNH